MIFFSFLAALSLEHYHPLRQPLRHFQLFAQYAALLREKFDGGEHAHGAIAWCLGVLPIVFAVWLVHLWLAELGFLLELIWGVAVLYLTMGLKYFSSVAEEIAAKLSGGQLEEARQDLQQWRGGDASAFDAREISSLTIEQLVVHSHRQTFGVLFWFVLLGPAGAVLFRLASILALRWRESSTEFSAVARKVFHALNWVPQRLTALTYAVAGNFEDAMYCWRSQASNWADGEEGIVLAAGAGAMGVRLGQPLNVGGQWMERPEIGLGDEPDADHIESANSMIWRGLVVWLVIALLLMVAGWAA
jgi:adenosylcobinamide-phosphate synthase